VASQVGLKRAHQELADSLGELRALERLRDDLVHMILHDMRGMLTVVLANLELASLDLSGQPALDVADAIRAAQTVTRMTNTVLDVSRLEEGKMPVKRVSTDIAILAAESARTFAAVDTARTILCTAADSVMAECDSDLVRRVIENLVSNAVKHTQSGGNVVVDVRRDNGRVRVSVTDDGAGVPEEVRAHLFEKFAAARKESKFHSAGLGLAFCRLAVEAHGGTIGVEPAIPNGSVFAFTIPV
jgi:signal transduction histidine kinase